MNDPLDIDQIEPRKIDGRSKEARAMRAEQAKAAAVPKRSTPRQEAPRQTLPREPARSSPRSDAEVIGRNGEVLSRTRSDSGDPFDVPKDLIESGWEMQWIAHSVYGNSEVVMDQNLTMVQNGWRPVNSDRPGFSGRFTPAGAKGHIIRGAQGLYERPKVLNDQARSEDKKKAIQQMRDRDEALMGGKANARNMPQGFEMGGKYRGTGGDLRMKIDPAVDAPAPQYELAPGEE